MSTNNSPGLSPLQLQIPNFPRGLPVSPSPHVRSGNDQHITTEQCCEHCANCKASSSSVSSPEPSPPLDPNEEKGSRTLSQQLSHKLSFKFIQKFTSRRKSVKSPLTSPRIEEVEYEQISPTQDWTDK